MSNTTTNTNTNVSTNLASTKDLKRVLGRKELLSIAIGQTIGSGVFALTGVAIGMTGRSTNLAMLIAAIFTLAMTVPMIFVSGTIRMRGGFYTQLALLSHKAFSGFFIIIHILAWSALSMYAISFADYTFALIPGINKTLVAFVVLTVIYLVNLFGMEGASKLQTLMTVIMTIAIVVFSAFGISKIQPGFFSPPDFMTNGVSGLFAAGALLTWAIGGANVVIHLGAEAKNPTKDIPFAVIAGTLIVAVFYAFMSTVASGVLPVSEVAGQPLTLVAEKVLSKPLYVLFVVGGAMFALITTLNACFGWVTKPILQASVDGWLPKGLGALNKYKTPYIILTLLYIESLIPIFFRFNVSTIGNMAVILNNLFFAIVCYSAINLPKVIPDLWAKSKYHVSYKVLAFFSILGAISTVAQIWLLVGVLTPAEFIGNGAVAIFAMGYSVLRLKSGKVNMEVSYEEAYLKQAMMKGEKVMKDYKNLLSPIKVGALTLRNRIEAAPSNTGNGTFEGFLTPESISYFELKAKGGAAIVTIGESNVHTKTGVAHGRMPCLDNPDILPSLIRTTDAIHRHGAFASIQLIHPGRRANKDYYNGTVYGPSAGEPLFAGPIVEMSEEVIQEVVEAFGDAAEMAKLGGCDMVMIHGAHGWLLHQFLSPLNNHRTDRFGGTLENRARISLMVIDNIRKKCGPGFPIEFRLSGSEHVEGGLTINDMVEFAKLIDGKVDIIHVSSCTFHNPATNTHMFPSPFHERGINVPLALEIKKAVKTPVAVVGGINDTELMEEIISSGKADIVALGRPLLADPYLPKKLMAKKEDDISPCVRCLVCLSGDFVPYIKYPIRSLKCSVNPVIGREQEVMFAKPRVDKKKVLIIGGGPAGMQAAVTASDRGHEVILCEKNDSLGGTINLIEDITFKEDLKKFKDVLIKRVNERAIKVMLNTEVTEEFIEHLAPDAVVAAIGAEPIMPKIPGMDCKNVITAIEATERTHDIGENVVIIGGGLMGCEEALNLAQKGKKVTVIEMRPDVIIDGAYLYREALMIEMKKWPIELITNTQCKAINEEGIIALDKEGNEVQYKGDTIIIATGLKPKSCQVDSLRKPGMEFYTIGDSLKARKVLDAVRSGYDIGTTI